MQWDVNEQWNGIVNEGKESLTQSRSNIGKSICYGGANAESIYMTKRAHLIISQQLMRYNRLRIGVVANIIRSQLLTSDAIRVARGSIPRFGGLLFSLLFFHLFPLVALDRLKLIKLIEVSIEANQGRRFFRLLVSPSCGSSFFWMDRTRLSVCTTCIRNLSQIIPLIGNISILYLSV